MTTIGNIGASSNNDLMNLSLDYMANQVPLRVPLDISYSKEHRK